MSYARKRAEEIRDRARELNDRGVPEDISRDLMVFADEFEALEEQVLPEKPESRSIEHEVEGIVRELIDDQYCDSDGRIAPTLRKFIRWYRMANDSCLLGEEIINKADKVVHDHMDIVGRGHKSKLECSWADGLTDILEPELKRLREELAFADQDELKKARAAIMEIMRHGADDQAWEPGTRYYDALPIFIERNIREPLCKKIEGLQAEIDQLKYDKEIQNAITEVLKLPSEGNRLAEFTTPEVPEILNRNRHRRREDWSMGFDEEIDRPYFFTEGGDRLTLSEGMAMAREYLRIEKIQEPI